ncbi:NUDIX domain protein [Streptomyces mobaraensis NBRC 13819 = DSM 40847]|uniref:NUDIX domain protein n=1 Tax=Streptomyces mobaraensis (strain ATCC 29032 / DSM 40847 / JCM 4168 / NBRC 13819 / NCIMB 11159 / IPCR 16-22) TaxID=1223523 RepID=M3C4H4_STRM1|nr:NUDIX domain protein [Streptomyces mobaraensis NBRC 13819 = DSM 40847]
MVDDWLKDSADVEASWVTVDLAIFTLRDGGLRVLLIERGVEPFLGWPALPGGYVQKTETLRQGALRELREEAGIDGSRLHLEQLGAYGDPGRDPRGRVVTVAYLALGPDLPLPVGGTDATHAYWAPVRQSDAPTPDLAFDHSVILADALEEIRRKLEYTAVATVFCGESFTLSELRTVYEVIWGQCLDPSNFRRKVLKIEGFVEPTGERRLPPTGRPAALYRRGSAWLLSTPLLRGTGQSV